MRLLLITALAIGFPFGLLLLHRIFWRLPPLAGRPRSRTIDPDTDSQIARLLRPHLQAHPELNGLTLLWAPAESLAARIAMTRAAEHSLDVQYYIWLNDISGSLLGSEILRAADRGVRVRLLLDDNGTSGLDDEIAALDCHPNIEVRLFNPFTTRRHKWVGYFLDFKRLNRRMHNKAFIADNQAAVMGGRNVGDTYFGATKERLFEDLDVFAIGPIVPDISTDFDRYWASRSSYPVSRLLPRAGPADIERIHQKAAEGRKQEMAKAYSEAIEQCLLLSQEADAADIHWARVRLISDDPRKGLGEAPISRLVGVRLAKIIGDPKQRLSLVSAYFVPTKPGTRWLSELSENGVDVTILTNALESTDVAAVHAGYAKHRRRLLKAGVRLWELKSAPGHHAKLGLGFGSGFRRRPAFSASGSSLHAKTFAVDDERIFIGSLNFDPRSVALNTESGLLIESPELAQMLDRTLQEDAPGQVYILSAAPGGGIEWHENTENGLKIHQTEPGTRWYQRALVWLIGRLPIDWLL